MQIAEEMTMTALSLVFLLLGVVLVASIIYSAFNPYEQIAVANTRKLAAMMNQVCISESAAPVEFQFDLPQNVPMGSNFLTVLPKWLMRNYGDPNFVLYYESYPPGEAIGWEVYHKFDNRLYMLLDESFDGKGIEALKEHAAKKGKEFVLQNPDTVLEGSVVANIILNSEYSGITTDKYDFNKIYQQEALNDEIRKGRKAATGGTPEEKFFAFGAWESAKSDPAGEGNPISLEERKEDYFRFKNYQGLPTVQKSLIKYESCAPGSLCLKTRSGVYRFPLKNCAGKDNFKTVQLVYDARNRKAVYGILGALAAATFIPAAAASGPAQLVLPGMAKIAGTAKSVSIFSKVVGIAKIALGKPVGFIWRAGSLGKLTVVSGAAEGIEYVTEKFLGAMLSLKTGDLALASPCSITEAKVAYDQCNDPEIKNSLNYKPCSSYIRHPTFEVDKKTGKLDMVRDKNNNIVYSYKCADKIESASGTDYTPVQSFDSNDKCVQLLVFEKPRGFCWTPDPSANDLLDWKNFDTKALAELLGFTPVRDNIEYFEATQDIALSSTRSEELESQLSRWERRLAWGWPGLDFTGPIEFTTELFTGGGR